MEEQSYDMGAPQAAPTPARKKSSAPIAAAVAAGLVVVAGGGAFAYTRLAGGGAQPDEVIPGSAFAYARVDLDPSVGQKVAAFRLMEKLPDAKKALESGDPKKALFEQLAKSGELEGVDYEKDVKPWLGDRFAVAAMAGEGDAAVPVVAVAVKDEAQARAGMEKLQAKAKEKARDKGVAKADEETTTFFRDGYLLSVPKKDEQRVRSAIEAGSLAKKEAFRGDMAALGDQGVASFWIDPVPMQKAIDATNKTTPRPKVEMPGLTDKQKPAAGALRFGADYVELASNSADPGLYTPKAVNDVRTLPKGTGAAMAIGGIGDLVGKMWQPVLDAAAQNGADVTSQVASFEKQTGLSLPGDLQTLLGDQLTVLVPQKLDSGAKQSLPGIAVRLHTDTGKAKGVLAKLEGSMGTGFPQSAQDGKLYLGLSDAAVDWAKGEGETPGALGTAVPGLDGAASMTYVDLDAYEHYYIDRVPSDYRELVRGLRAIGVSGGVKDGRSVGSIRLVVN